MLSCAQIANDWNLWNKHVNADAAMTREEFDALTTEQKVALQVKAFGPKAADAAVSHSPALFESLRERYEHLRAQHEALTKHLADGLALKAPTVVVKHLGASDMRADPESLRARLQTWPLEERRALFGDLFA